MVVDAALTFDVDQHGDRAVGDVRLTLAGRNQIGRPAADRRTVAELQIAVTAQRPLLVLALGQAAGRAEMTPDRVAINVDDARIADNAGAAPIDTPVVARGPAAYFSTLPVKAMVAAMQQAGVPAAVSQTAGTFVCNHVFYGLMHLLRRRRTLRGGFMHLPLLPEQAAARPGQPSLPLDRQVAGVRVALAAARDCRIDLHLGGGAVS